MEKRENLSHCHHFVMVLLGFWDFFFFFLFTCRHFGYSLSVCVCVEEGGGGDVIPQWIIVRYLTTCFTFLFSF